MVETCKARKGVEDCNFKVTIPLWILINKGFQLEGRKEDKYSGRVWLTQLMEPGQRVDTILLFIPMAIHRVRFE